MKRLILGLFASLFILAVQAQSTGDAKAEIKFEVTEHDFGKITEGTMAVYEFVFTNTGTAPLVLSDVHPSCGCTSPEWPREPIAPGTKGKVKAIFNSAFRPGVFEKYIDVKSNTSTPQITLKIKGVVEPKPVEPQSPVRNQGVE